MDVVNLVKNAKTVAVDMFNNTITLDGKLYSPENISFNCNWEEQEIVQILDVNSMNAECHGVSLKTNDGKINLPIKESIILKSNVHDIMSIGFYRTANKGEV